MVSRWVSLRMNAAKFWALRSAAVCFRWLIDGEASSHATPPAASTSTSAPTIASRARFESFGCTTTYEAPQCGQSLAAVDSERPHAGQSCCFGANAACTSARVRSRAAAHSGEESHDDPPGDKPFFTSSAIASPA